MQQIERYGVIALVFLLVTIVAVSFWGDNKSPGFWSRLTGRGDAKKTEIAKNAATAERALDNALPLNTNPSPIPGEIAAPAPSAAVVVQPLPQTAESAIANANQPAGAISLPGNVPAAANAPGQAMLPATQSPAPILAAAPVQQAPVFTPQKSEAAAVKAPRNVTSTGPTTEYVVQKGDSLASIAQKNLGSSSRWTEIQSLNGGIQPKSLRVGTKLKLPGTITAKTGIQKSAPKADSPAQKKAAPAASESAQSGAVYVVRAGDTLRTIAEKKLGNGDRWKEIVAANPGLDPQKLAVGKSLKLPAGAAREARESRPLVAAATGPARSSGTSGKPHVR